MKMKNEKITGESRLVWMGGPGQGGEAPAAAAEAGKKAPAPTPAEQAAADAAAQAKQKERGAKVAETARQDETGKDAQAEAILAAFGGSGGDTAASLAESMDFDIGDVELTAPLTANELQEWSSRYEPVLKTIIAAYKGKLPEKSREMGKKYIEALDKKGFKLALRIIFAPPTQDEKNKLLSNLDLGKIVKDIKDGNIGLRDGIIFIALIQENPPAPELRTALSKTDDPTRKEIESFKKFGAFITAAREKLSQPTYSAEQVDDVFKKVYTAYKDAYDQFLKDGKKEEFLAKITDKDDKKIIKWALEAPVTIAEKTALAEKLITMTEAGTIQGPKNDDEINALVSAHKINFREGMILKALRVEEEGTGPEIPSELKGLGLVELITKLVEKLTALMEKLGTKLDTMFKSKKNEFPKSPIGDNQKFTIKQAAAGVDLKAESPDQNVTAVMDGEVTEIKGDTITIEVANQAKITYTGITQKPGLKKDDTIKAGETLGKMKSDTLNFQMSDSAGTAMDKAALETLLGKYKKTPPEATQQTQTAEATPETPAFEAKQPPIKIAANAKLEIKQGNDFEGTKKQGIIIKAPQSTQVQMVSDGKITKAENGEVVVEFQGGKKLVYKGLVIDAGMSAKSGQQMTAGATIGKINDKGELTIQTFQNETQINPATTDWLKQWIA